MDLNILWSFLWWLIRKTNKIKAVQIKIKELHNPFTENIDSLEENIIHVNKKTKAKLNGIVYNKPGVWIENEGPIA